MIGDTPYDAEAGLEAGTKAAGRVQTGGFTPEVLSQAGCFAVAGDIRALLFSIESGEATRKARRRWARCSNSRQSGWRDKHSPHRTASTRPRFFAFWASRYQLDGAFSKTSCSVSAGAADQIGEAFVLNADRALDFIKGRLDNRDADRQRIVDHEIWKVCVRDHKARSPREVPVLPRKKAHEGRARRVDRRLA